MMHFLKLIQKKYQIKSDVKPLSLKSLQLGDIVQYVDKNGKTQYFTVCYKKKDGDFYYYISDKTGDLRGREDMPISHSNMFIVQPQIVPSFKIVGKKKFKIKKIKEFEIVKTGIPVVDKRMAQLGGLYEVFNKYAPKSLKKRFDAMEDQNYHSENDAMIDSFVKWIAKDKDPKEFEKQYKFPELPSY